MKSINETPEMVRAYLDGRKDMFRVPINPQPPKWKRPKGDYSIIEFREHGNTGNFRWLGAGMICEKSPWNKIWRSPYLPGETIYVKEWYGLIYLPTGQSVIGGPQPKGDEWNDFEIVYRATMSDFESSFNYKWFNPHFMPERASRLKLRILTAGAEQLQKITEKDAKREGHEPFGGMCVDRTRRIKSFELAWNARYAHRPEYQWSKNGWVWKFGYEIEKSLLQTRG